MAIFNCYVSSPEGIHFWTPIEVSGSLLPRRSFWPSGMPLRRMGLSQGRFPFKIYTTIMWPTLSYIVWVYKHEGSNIIWMINNMCVYKSNDFFCNLHILHVYNSTYLYAEWFWPKRNGTTLGPSGPGTPEDHLKEVQLKVKSSWTIKEIKQAVVDATERYAM